MINQFEFKYVEIDYFHETDWTAKAVFDGYEYNVIKSFVDSIYNHTYELSILKVKDKDTLRRVLNVIAKSKDVAELIRAEPLNTGYPRYFTVILRSPISVSTRYRARLFGGIEVLDFIANGVEHWGFLFPTNTNLQPLYENLKTRGKINKTRERKIDLNEALSSLSSNLIAPMLTRAELRTLRRAYELGYFNEDNRVTLRQLAKELNLSVTTVDKQIRSSIRKILRLILTQY